MPSMGFPPNRRRIDPAVQRRRRDRHRTALRIGAGPAGHAPGSVYRLESGDGRGRKRFSEIAQGAGYCASSLVIPSAGGCGPVCQNPRQPEGRTDGHGEDRECDHVPYRTGVGRLHRSTHAQLQYGSAAGDSGHAGREIGGLYIQSAPAGGAPDMTMSVEGHPAKDGEAMQAFYNVVSPGYWKAMGVPLLQGREFDESDRTDPSDKNAAPNVAVVDRAFAEHYFGQRSPVGRHLGYFGQVPGAIRIVGEVENSLFSGPRGSSERKIFFPYLHTNSSIQIR